MVRNAPCAISGTRVVFVVHLVGGGERCCALLVVLTACHLIGRVRFGSLPCPKSYTRIVIAVSQPKLF